MILGKFAIRGFIKPNVERRYLFAFDSEKYPVDRASLNVYSADICSTP